MRNPLWSSEYTGKKPTYDRMRRLAINPAHPLNQGMVAWWMLNEGAGVPVSLSGRDRIALGAGCSMGPNGMSVVAGVVSSATSSFLPVGTTDFTISLTLYEPTPSNSYPLACTGGDAGTAAALNYRPAASTITWCMDGYQSVTWSVYNFNPYTNAVLITRKGSIFTLYVNGVSQGDATNATANTFNNFYRIGHADAYFVGRILDMQFFTKYTDPVNSKMLFSHPYGTPDNPRFIVLPRASYFFPSAGAGPTDGSYTQPSASARPTVTVATLTGIRIGSYSQPSASARPTVTPVTLIGVRRGTYTQPSTSARPTVTAATLVGVRRGTYTQPSTSARPTITAATLTGIRIGSYTQPSVSARPTITVATFTSGSPGSGTWTMPSVSCQPAVCPGNGVWNFGEERSYALRYPNGMLIGRRI